MNNDVASPPSAYGSERPLARSTGPSSWRHAGGAGGPPPPPAPASLTPRAERSDRAPHAVVIHAVAMSRSDDLRMATASHEGPRSAAPMAYSPAGCAARPHRPSSPRTPSPPASA